ncbi:uncharacterized protein N7458_001748 [Penicillium daleae]|uniref:Uncharacterized protein n=1 Tax=Penicillium daleae TaxID=63821 RepID=A0AAD6CCA8_9EURO|nr:uncharacterized protein N7458_001748 [Penicillium daleae]KAJ5460196.1 hypothetical protein N7458_001748 [Penicillium daleae]
MVRCTAEAARPSKLIQSPLSVMGMRGTFLAISQETAMRASGSDPILWVKDLFAAWKERLLLTQKNDHDDHEVISIENFMAVGDVKYHKII